MASGADTIDCLSTVTSQRPTPSAFITGVGGKFYNHILSMRHHWMMHKFTKHFMLWRHEQLDKQLYWLAFEQRRNSQYLVIITYVSRYQQSRNVILRYSINYELTHYFMNLPYVVGETFKPRVTERIEDHHAMCRSNLPNAVKYNNIRFFKTWLASKSPHYFRLAVDFALKTFIINWGIQLLLA